MIKFAPYINIYDFEESKELQTEVLWTFSKHLSGVSSSRYRFNIHVVKDKSWERKHLDGSIKSIWKFWDIDNFKKLSIQEKKENLLELIKESFLEVSKALNWNTDAILTAAKIAYSEHLIFKYSTKPKSNKTRDTRASIKLELDGQKVSIFIDFFHKDGSTTLNNHLIDTATPYVEFFGHFKTPKWIDSTHFGFELGWGLILTMSSIDYSVVWDGVQSNQQEYLKRLIDYNDISTPEELVKLANC